MSTIRNTLQTALQDIQTQWGIPDPVLAEITVPTHRTHGDYSTSLVMALWKQRASWSSELQARFSQPRQLADALVTELEQRSDGLFRRIEVAGPGFINLTLADSYFYSLIQNYNLGNILSGLHLDEKPLAIVEYSSPNIAKPFTIGHLRSTIIGDAIANIYEAIGWEVKRDNHLGDWGTQFGKQIYALRHLGKGNLEANLAELEKAQQPVKYLVDLYIEFHTLAETKPELEEEGRAWFKKLEDGDQEARRIWQLCIDYSWKEFEQIYAKLGVKFTENSGRGFGESYFEDKMAVVLEQLSAADQAGKLGFQTGKEDAKLIFFPQDELPPLMVLKKDGATLYATRDLATDFWRKQQYPGLQLIINEVGAEQSLYFEQIFRTEALLGWYTPGQRVHVKHGLYRFADKKMSTRKGNVIWLADVLAEAESRAARVAEGRDLPANTASKVGIGALKWNDLKRSSHLDVTFDWDEILSMQGNSGPYLQYTYVRAANILRKAGAVVSTNEEYPAVILESERELALKLGEFATTLTKAAAEFAPHHVCTYLFEVAQLFNTFYTQVPVLNADDEIHKNWRLKLVQATRDTVQQGLHLLGIETVEEM